MSSDMACCPRDARLGSLVIERKKGILDPRLQTAGGGDLGTLVVAGLEEEALVLDGVPHMRRGRT
jgi:hypothetical protein